MATIWLADYPPETPHAVNDEFDDASVAGAWTEYDPDNVTTVSEAASGLVLTNSGATFGLTGVYQAIPSGDFSIWTRAALRTAGVYFAAGLFIAQDLATNPTTADFVHAAISNSVGIIGELRPSYAAGAASATAIADTILPWGVYLRLRYTAATYVVAGDWSINGIGWQNYFSYTLASAAVHMGLFTYGNSFASQSATLAFFRCEAGNALTAIMGGRRVDPDPAPAAATNVPRRALLGVGW
jgi:hypothetical protein